MPQLVGDEQGIEALRELSETNREFLKHLIMEARTSSDHTATFQSPAGTKYTLTLNAATGELDVQPA